MKIQSISQLIPAAVTNYGNRPALLSQGKNSSESLTYRELDDLSGQLAGGLYAQGVRAGDHVAILSESRPRWGLAFFAAIRAGAVVVPLDIQQSPEELARALKQCNPRVLLVSRDLEDTAADLATLFGSDLYIASLETAATKPHFPSIDELQTEAVPELPLRGEHDAAVLSFTSGTMGCSKGVVTTHGNLLFQVRAVREVFHNDSRLSTVSILPLSHLFELTAGFLSVLYGGGSVCYCNSLLPREIVDAMRAHEVTGMAVVPLFLKLFADSIRRKVRQQSRTRRFLISAMSAIASWLPMSTRRSLFRELHACLGGSLQYFVCGGAPLDVETRRFFDNIGLPVYQGYGLAESSPIVASNGPSANRPGSVGKPLPGIEVRITDKNEVLTRGPHVMRGYYREDELTASVIDDDGWLHTGDLGYLDDDGYLFINGREKNIIVLGSGKKVQPEEVEPQLFEHPFIEEGCIVGIVSRSGLTKDSEEVCAVAVASERAIRTCAEKSLDIESFIRRVIQEQARRFPACLRPSRVMLSRSPLPRTSTRKVRRQDVARWVSNKEVTA